MENINNDNIHFMLGEAFYQKNNMLISLINQYIRENNIKLTKRQILCGIYYAEIGYFTRSRYYKSTGFGEFTDELYYEYYDKYNHLLI